MDNMEDVKKGRFPSEIESFSIAVEIANDWGYGNLINFLQNEWKDKLISSGLSKEAAIAGVNAIKL